MRFFAALSLALIGFASAGAAATFTESATPTAAILNPTSTVFTGTYGENVTTSVTGERKNPWEGSSVTTNPVFSSINGSVTFAFSSLLNTLKIVWGSPDAYNSLQFLYNGAVVDTVTGSNITSQFGSNIATSLITITTAAQFNSVKFISTLAAFEFANVEAVSVAPLSSVPVPAGGVLLLSAFGGVAVLRRRKSA